jgi:DNA polymerase IIIc chi subunit
MLLKIQLAESVKKTEKKKKKALKRIKEIRDQELNQDEFEDGGIIEPQIV